MDDNLDEPPHRTFGMELEMTDDMVGRYRFIRQSHGRGAFGEVHVVDEPTMSPG
jgi:hypothetical protein